MKVLITGGGGFIGSHLVDSQLGRRHQVRTVDLNLDRLSHAAGHNQLETIFGDVSDPSLIRQLVDGIDVVYHLASAHLDVTLSESAYRRVNVEASQRLVEAAQAAGVNRFVHCSSVGVYGEIKSPPADEMAPCNPTNPYERTKLAGERAVLQFAQRTGFAVVVVRPSWVYGPRCPRTEKLCRAIRRRRFVVFGDGQTLRHPLYISDAVRGLELCAETEYAAGQTYVIAGQRPVTIEELVKVIAEVNSVSPPRLRLPLVVGTIAGTGFQCVFKLLGRQPPFSRRTLDFFAKNNAYGIGKAQDELGFQPLIDLRTGFAKTRAWQQQVAGQERPVLVHG